MERGIASCVRNGFIDLFLQFSSIGNLRFPTMDIKGLAWIGNIYDKFEAMCLEMEEVMYQDTAKYVENQVQTVGASVKKFYSEVMQDLDPESHIDPVKVAAADLSLNPYAQVEMVQKSSAKKDAFENIEKLADDYKVISGKNKTGAYKRPIARRRGHSSINYTQPVSGSMPPISGNLTTSSSFSQRRGSHGVVSSSKDVTISSATSEGNSGETKDKICNQVVDTIMPLSRASVEAALAGTKLSTLSSERKQADSAGDTSCSGSLAIGTSAADAYTNRAAVSETDRAIKNDAGLSKSAEEGVVMSHKERLDECSSDAAKNEDVIDEEVEIIEKFNEPMLAETCVLVEEDMLHSIDHGDDKQKSYKKKIREAFSTKKRLTRKEYEKLAERFKEKNSNSENAERLMPIIGDSNAKISSSVRNCPDSDWELL